MRCVTRRLILFASFAALVTVLVAAVSTAPALAHASLVRSEPPANAVLSEPPAEIRLWFSEPMEAAFSRFTLRDTDGQTVDTPASQVDPADPTQMFMRFTHSQALSDGLYTVLWQSVSITDGHAVKGSFTFSVGAVGVGAGGAAALAGAIPVESAVVRWLNLISLSLAVGGVGFVLLVWPSAQRSRAARRLIAGGWLFAGLMGVVVLAHHVSQVADIPLGSALGDPALGSVITETRYGALWAARMALWLGMGAALWLGRQDGRWCWLALACGSAMLLTVSLYSHASNAQDAAAAIAGDWLHLLATALWLGGLAQFLVALGALSTSKPDKRAALVGSVNQLVVRFSSFARLTVAALIVTGLYAAWLQVGSPEALLTTLHGQALLIKLILIVPLLAVAAINLLVTGRRLRAGNAAWIMPLRGLVGAEIALGVAVLAAVGVLTSVMPARAAMEQQSAASIKPSPAPITLGDFVDGIRIDLTISPGYPGENTFSANVYEHNGKPVADASLVKVRLTNLDEKTARGEVELLGGTDGVYAATSAALSLPGQWEMRVTVRRPGKYDTIAAFTHRFNPPPAQSMKAAAPLAGAIPALLLTGAVLVGIGGFAGSQNRLAAAALILVGGVFVISGGVAFGREGRQSTRSAPDSAAINIQLAPPAQPFTVGNTILEFALRDVQEKPVGKAAVDVTGDMNHAGMQPVFGTGAEVTAGRYVVPFEFTMSGDWILTVRATLPDGTSATQTFNVTVQVR